MKIILAAILVFAASGSTAQATLASWYHLPGNRTASGEMYSDSGHTCAHRSHRFGTKLKVTDLATGRSVVCRVNDRGPFIHDRVVDLNRGAAHALGIIQRGVVSVSVQVIK